MSRPVQQHYVTRAYLDGFVPKDEKHLHVYTRGKNNGFASSPENIAKIRNYYSTKKPDGTFDDRIEHMLQTMFEDPGLAVIRKLDSGKYNLSRNARARLSALIAIQEYRVPWMRDQMKLFYQRALEDFTQAMATAPGVIEKTLIELSLAKAEDVDHMAAQMRRGWLSGDIELRATPEASLHAIGQMLKFLPDVYFTMGWEILESITTPFITSDCPVHRYYVPIWKDIPYGGLMDKRVQIRFPLSKSKMLVIRHDRKRLEMVEALRIRRGQREAQKAANRASQIRHVRVSPEDVRTINSHTASMASRYIFSPTKLEDGAELVTGECKNVRQVFINHPDGSTEFKAMYPD